MLGNPARRRGAAWNDPAREPADEGALPGRRGLALLADLEVARSTTDLAVRHAMAAPTVSHHLGRMHRAGLVARRREGRRVLYSRTDRGTAIVTALTGAQ